MDDSHDEDNVLAMAKTMATTERLAAESRRQIRMEKQLTATWRRTPEAVGVVHDDFESYHRSSHAASVGPKRPALSGGHKISGSSVGEEPLDSPLETNDPVRSGAGESVLSRTRDPKPPPMNGRQGIRVGSVIDEVLSSPSGADASEKSGIGEMAFSPSDCPWPSPLSGQHAVEGGTAMKEPFSSTSAQDSPSVRGGAVRGPLLRQNARRGGDSGRLGDGL